MSNWIILALGFLAQGFFSARMLVQWIMSEKAKKVVSPTIFWVFSVAGSYLFFVYGWLRNDFAIMFGQVISYYIYLWNLKIKGVWNITRDNSRQDYWRLALLAILIITPLCGIAYILSDWEQFKMQCLNNNKIPSLLIIYGSLGQLVFTLRFVYQFIYSKKRHSSSLPAGFWIISLTGSAIIVSYAFIRKDPVLALGQSVGFITYSRNLYLIFKRHLEPETDHSKKEEER